MDPPAALRRFDRPDADVTAYVCTDYGLQSELSLSSRNLVLPMAKLRAEYIRVQSVRALSAL